MKAISLERFMLSSSLFGLQPHTETGVPINVKKTPKPVIQNIACTIGLIDTSTSLVL